MKDTKILLSVPATIYDFGETENLTTNKYVTRAKLKVFSVGKTVDFRVFTEEFSAQLLKTLPGTPVVAYYSEEKEDFKGHNVVQHVFGYVPENAKIEYVEEDSKKFAVTDVILFTGRDDNIGVIASKIVGKQHSLELDPKTVEYKLVRKGSVIESMTFTKGDFIGLSVLGDDEKPGFAGSEFFPVEDSTELMSFISSFKEFKEEVELFKSGGQGMDENQNLNPILKPTSHQQFMEMTLNEKISEAYSLLEDAGYYAYFIDEQDSKFIFRTYEVGSGEIALYRVAIVDKTITEMEQVHIRYFTEKEIDSVTQASNIVTAEADEDKDEDDDDDKKEEDNFVEPQTEVVTESAESTEVVTEASAVDNVDSQDNQVVAQAGIIEGIEDVGTQTKTQENEVDTQVANSAALDDAERQELNEYRKQAKFELIENYEELSEEIKNKYREKHANYSIAELDKELAFELVTSQRQKNNNKKGLRVFQIIEQVNAPASSGNTILDLVNKYKD